MPDVGDVRVLQECIQETSVRFERDRRRVYQPTQHLDTRTKSRQQSLLQPRDGCLAKLLLARVFAWFELQRCIRLARGGETDHDAYTSATLEILL